MAALQTTSATTSMATFASIQSQQVTKQLNFFLSFNCVYAKNMKTMSYYCLVEKQYDILQVIFPVCMHALPVKSILHVGVRMRYRITYHTTSRKNEDFSENTLASFICLAHRLNESYT